jgi:hypothetical protein
MKSWSNSDIPAAGNNIPEKRLFAAVLQRAITDFLTGEGEVKEGARLWLMEDEPTDAPLTFLFICESLDLDSLSLRKAILKQSESSVEMLIDETAESASKKKKTASRTGVRSDEKNYTSGVAAIQ